MPADGTARRAADALDPAEALAARGGGAARVVAVLHNLSGPSSATPAPALRGRRRRARRALPARRGPAAGAGRGRRDRRRSAASRTRSTPALARAGRAAARRRRARRARCSASASARSCSPTRSAARCASSRGATRLARARPLPAADGDPVLGALPPGAAGVHWNEDGFALPAGAVELLRSPAGTGEGFRAGECVLGRAVPPRARRRRARRLVRATGTSALAQAGVTEEAARAADREHLPGQRALSEAIFGGFARVVARRVQPRSAVSRAMAEQTCPRRRHRHRLRDVRRPGGSRAAARDGPGDADDRLARGLLRRAGRPRLPRDPLRQPRRRPLDARCATSRCRRCASSRCAPRRRPATRSRTWPATPSACSTTSGSSARTWSAPRWAA